MANASFDKNSQILCRAIPSLNKVIDGTSSFIQSYVMSKFPNNLFKSSYISNELKKIKIQVQNQKLPLFGMKATFELDESLMGPINRQYTNVEFVNIKDKNKVYRLVFEDRENRIKIHSVEMRIKMKFDFTMIFQTEMQAWNIISYMNQLFLPNSYQYANGIELPAELPYGFVKNICSHFNWDITDKEDRLDLKEYLISHTTGGIFETKDLATGNMMFTYPYTTNLLMQNMDPPTHDIETTGVITKNSTVRYSMEVEQWIPGSYVMEIKNNTNIIKEYIEDDIMTGSFDILIDRAVIPKELNSRMKYLDLIRYQPDINVAVDELDVSEAIQPSILNILKKVSKFETADLEKLMYVKVFENNIPLDEDQYHFDYKTSILKTKTPKSNVTYAVVIYVDIADLNMLDQFYRGIDRNINFEDLQMFK